MAQFHLALFESWGWEVDHLSHHVECFYYGHRLPAFLSSAARSPARRWLLRLKWDFFLNSMVRLRAWHGERRYVRMLNLCYRLRLIDERWHFALLHAILRDWSLRSAGLSAPMRQALRRGAARKLMSNFDVVVTAYTPYFISLAAELREIYDLPVVALSAHRYDQNKRDAEHLSEWDDDARRLDAMTKSIKGVNDEYDYDYDRHYLKIEPARLYARPAHVRAGVVEEPSSRVIPIVWRNHPPHSPHHFADEIKSAKEIHCREQGVDEPKYRARDFRRAHPYYKNIEELRQYPAFIVLPYSAYAYFHFELFALNVPIFIPSIDFAIDRKIFFDRALYPVWTDINLYKNMRDDADAPDSPNSYHPEAQRMWIARTFLYRRKSCVVFDDYADLFRKLDRLEEDRRRIQQGMVEENRQLDQISTRAWREALEVLQLPIPQMLDDAADASRLPTPPPPP